ncbi:MAG TPA: sensor histidine kinase N-terminal domain-containing protein, partial [Gammaproteobacteria bacterium]|nr:sensor histidine kinase N-terminal domain-containing protein [Gammaproteobacteria bacterium]
MISLRRRLLVTLLTLFVLAWVWLMGMTYLNAREEIHEVFDAQLAQAAHVLLELTRHELEEEESADEFRADMFQDRLVHAYEKKVAFQVWRHGELLLRSPSAPERRMVERAGYSDVTLDGQRWRVLYTSGEDHGFEVIVGDREDVRAELVGHVVQQLFVPIGIALPLLGMFVWFGVGRGLAPLARAEREIASRSPTQLEPVGVSQVPEEIHGLVGALNHLLARLQEALDGERRFTAHAAHELRTPLAALKTQAQVALRMP